MADNVAITAGSGTTIAADDIGGVLHQRVKISQGADGVATDVSSVAPLNVTLANTGPNATPIVVDLGSNNDVTITGTVPISASSLPLPTGATTEATFDTKTGSLTETAPASDTASSGLNGRLQRIAQRLTSLIALLPTALGANGGLKIEGVASGTVVPISVATIPSHAVTNVGTFAVQSTNQANSGVDIGDVTINNASGASAVNIQDGGNSITVDGTVGVSGTVATSMATNTPVGNVAHDAADSGAPIKVGGRARTSDITSVASDDRVDFISDKSGRQVIFPFCLPENLVSGAITTSMTGTTSTSLIAAPGASLYNYITQITVSNAHATVGTDVAIQDGSGGTTIYTIPAAAVYGGAAIQFNPPLKQPTSNTALYCANVTTGASTKVSASGFKGY